MKTQLPLRSRWMPSSFRLHGGRAFTLIELLVVIAIVGVLATIAIPVVLSVRSNARAVQCSSNLRQIALSLLAYTADHRGRTVVSIMVSGDNWSELLTKWNGSYGVEFGTWQKPGNPGIWRCPENETQTYGPVGTGLDQGSYMINGWSKSDQPPNTENRYAYNSAANFAKPSLLYMVLEGNYYRANLADSQDGAGNVPDGAYRFSGSLNQVRYAHSGKVNVAFADGHVELVSGPIMNRGSYTADASQNAGFANGNHWFAQ